MERRDFIKLTTATGVVTSITPAGVIHPFVTKTWKHYKKDPPLQEGD